LEGKLAMDVFIILYCAIVIGALLRSWAFDKKFPTGGIAILTLITTIIVIPSAARFLWKKQK